MSQAGAPWVFESPEVWFRFWTFVEHLALHLFYPFSLPIYYCFRGKAPLIVQGFLIFKLRFLVFNHFFSAAFPLMIALWCVYKDELREQGFTVVEVIVPCTLFAIHRLMLSVKYASLSKKEYKRLMSITDIPTAEALQGQLQILSGWLGSSPEHIEYELWAAQQRNGLNLERTTFVVDKIKPTFIDNTHNRVATTEEEQINAYVSAWYKFLGKMEYLHNRSVIQFSAEALCLKLINLSYLSASHRYKLGYFFQFCILAAVVHALLPGVIREYEATMDDTGNHFFGNTWFSVLFVVVGILMSIVFFITNFMFVVCALTDVRRQYHLLVQTGRLIRPYSRANKQYLPSTTFTDYRAARHKKDDDFLAPRPQDPSPRAAGGAAAASPAAASASETADNADLVPPADFTSDQSYLPWEDPFPFLDMGLPENVRAWLYTRIILHDIGQRYRVRLRVCVAMALAVNVILAIALVMRLAVNYNDATVLQRDPALYVTVFDVVVWCGLLLLIIVAATGVNNLSLGHTQLLLEHRMLLRDSSFQSILQQSPTIGQSDDQAPIGQEGVQMRSLSSRNAAASVGSATAAAAAPTRAENRQVDEDRLEAADELLETAVETLEVMLEANPVRVLAFKADYSFASSYATFVASFLMFVVQKVFFDDYA